MQIYEIRIVLGNEMYNVITIKNIIFYRIVKVLFIYHIDIIM